MSYDSVPIGFDPRNVPEQYLHFEGSWAHYAEGSLMGVRGWDRLDERAQDDIVYGSMVERDLLDRRMREDVALAQGTADMIAPGARPPIVEEAVPSIGQRRAPVIIEPTDFTGNRNVSTFSHDSYPVSRNGRTTLEEVYCETTDRPRARRLVIGLAIATAVAGTIALIHGSNDSQAPLNDTTNPIVAEEDIAPNFSCRVNGIVENEDGTGRLQFASPLGNKVVELATANPDGGRSTLASPTPNAADSTLYTFSASNLHGKTVVTYAQGVRCQGAFTLGRQGPGDENFVSN